ncbi:hypothetical protein [Lonsdalea britannica]|nr:hypothetical protein [Lonsdalea britannica]
MIVPHEREAETKRCDRAVAYSEEESCFSKNAEKESNKHSFSATITE